MSRAAWKRTVMLPVLPGAMSPRRKVVVSLRSIRDSLAVTAATAPTSLVAPLFWKEMVTSLVSPGATGFSRGERVTSTGGWGTLSRPRAGMLILSVMLPWTREMLLW